MSKKKSIIILTIFAVLVIGLALIIVPLNGKDSFKIGKSNYDFYWISKAISMGLDISGGLYAEYEPEVAEGEQNPEGAIDGAINNLEELLFSKGYSEATVTKQGSGDNTEIRVEVPNIKDTDELLSLISKPAELEFRDADGNVLISGTTDLKDVGTTQDDGQYVIALQFNDVGTEKWAEATEANLNKQIYIYIDDQEFMKPTVQSVMTNGSAIITSPEYASDLNKATEYAVKLKAGASAVKLNMLRSEAISSTLGDNAVINSIIAAAIGLILICLLMCVLYRMFGVASSLALLLYVELLMLFLAVVPWVQLTLPGIAGVILSIGMAVDANVIIFERIKEIKQVGNRSIMSATKQGFSKALISIIDSNVTTIIGSIVMLIFGSSAIKSFALTLLIGVVISLVTAIFITRTLIYCFLAFDEEKDALYGFDAVVAKEVK